VQKYFGANTAALTQVYDWAYIFLYPYKGRT